MSDNRHPFEDRLRARAAKRTGAPAGEPPLPGHVREALLRDVRQRWPVNARESARWWERYAPRLAFACSICAFGLLVAGSLLREPASEVDTRSTTSASATQTPSSTEATIQSEDRKDAGAADDTDRLYFKQATAPRDKALSDEAPPRPAQAEISSTPTLPAREERQTELAAAPTPKPAITAAPALDALSPSPSVPPAATSARRYSAVRTREPQGSVIRFSRAEAQPSETLSDFTVQLTGSELVLRDKDGSLYRGVTRGAPGDLTKTAASAAPPVLFFSAAGTNSATGLQLQIEGTIENFRPTNSVSRLSTATREGVQERKDLQRLRAVIKRVGATGVTVEAVSGPANESQP